MPSTASVLARPGVLGQARWGGQIVAVAACARCERVWPMVRRGLCYTCARICRADGTIWDYGYTKADKMADYALARGRGLTVSQAAVQAGVDPRTGQRYEKELADTDRAPWRATDVNVQYAARRYHVLMARNL